jgi:hypothetical protein
MAVVINDFEVVPESQPAQQAAGTASSSPQSSSGPTAHDIELMIRKMAERSARLRAH